MRPFVLERFRQVSLFADLPDDDLARICAEAKDVRLAAGEVLFREGDPGDRAFVVTSGELEVLKRTDRREVLIAVRGEDQIIGELALLEEAPRSATVRARTRADLVSIPKAALDDLLATSTAAARSIFDTLVRRIRETNDQQRHQERMVQLGVLTAGVAHELNNPSAAVQRGAEHLRSDLDRLLGGLTGSSPAIAALLDEVAARPVMGDRSPVEVSDEEAAVEDWLNGHGVADPWELAPELVDAGIGVADLDRLGANRDLAGHDLPGSVRLLAAAVAVRRSAAEVAEGSRRLSDIVRVLRSYSYLDRAPVQDVDVVQGIEDTLMLLGHATKGVRIVREYADDLPMITGLGGELNQVWTNLIHNACDALAETPDPTLTLRASRAKEHSADVVVEVEDNGPGIPADLQQRIFDAFFTTKEPGKGTGLGLQISYRIVVTEHGGELTVDSQPGRTTFRVLLPISPPTQDGTEESAEGSEPVALELCDDLRAVENTPKPEGGCRQCLEVGDTWVHLRFCATCGQVGCCDDSKNRHASRHARASGHPVLRTKEPGENWAWCVEHEVGVELP